LAEQEKYGNIIPSTIPRSFAPQDKEKASFWAWLTAGHVVEIPNQEGHAELEVMNRDELKRQITQAMEADNSSLATELLEIAEGESQLSEEMIRKTVRVASGEYLKLLYVKLRDNSSFSDVVMKLLTPEFKTILEAIRAKPYGSSNPVKERLDYAAKQVDEWKNEKPDSRRRDIDLESGIFGKYIEPKQPEQISDSAQVIDYVMAELHGRVDNDARNYEEIWEYLQKRWRRRLGERLMDNVSMSVIQDPENTNKIHVRPEIGFPDRVEDEDLQDLLDKFEKGTLTRFAEMIKGDIPLESSSLKGERYILFTWQVPLPAFAVSVLSREQISVDPIHDEASETREANIENHLWQTSYNLAGKIGLPNDYFKTEYENDQRAAAGVKSSLGKRLIQSGKLRFLIQTATEKASTTRDFAQIKEVVSSMSRIEAYKKVDRFLDDIIYQSLSSRSVVSFYINPEVWRLLSIVDGKIDWLALADRYLRHGHNSIVD